MTNEEIIIKYWQEHKGEHVIDVSHNVKRFVAILDGTDDYYYVLYDGKNFSYDTCVLRLVWIKNKIDQDDYQEFIRLAKLNHLDQPTLWGNKDPDRLLLKCKMHKDTLVNELLNNKNRLEEHHHRLLTEICWDLN